MYYVLVTTALTVENVNDRGFSCCMGCGVLTSRAPAETLANAVGESAVWLLPGPFFGAVSSMRLEVSAMNTEILLVVFP